MLPTVENILSDGMMYLALINILSYRNNSWFSDHHLIWEDQRFTLTCKISPLDKILDKNCCLTSFPTLRKHTHLVQHSIHLVMVYMVDFSILKNNKLLKSDYLNQLRWCVFKIHEIWQLKSFTIVSSITLENLNTFLFYNEYSMNIKMFTGLGPI